MNNEAAVPAPLNLASIRAKIEQARKVKTEKSVNLMVEEIAAKQVCVDLLVRKQKTLETILEALRRDRDQLSKDLSELESTRDFMEPADYQASKNGLFQAIANTEKSIDEQTTAWATIGQEIKAKIGELIQLRDRKTALADPNFKPRLDPEREVDICLGACRPGLVEIHNVCRDLEPRLKTFHPDTYSIVLTLNIQAAKLRHYQTTVPPNPVEGLILKRCFKYLLTWRERFFAGTIEAINPEFKTNWAKYIDEKIQLLNSRLAQKQQAAQSNGKDNKKTLVEEPEEKLADTEELALVAKIVNSGLIKHTQELRLALYGGIGTRSSDQGKKLWLENTLKLSKLDWYECTTTNDDLRRIVQSIKSGGADLVLIFNQWTGHSSYAAVVQVCRAYNIRPIQALSSSTQEICKKIAHHFGIDLEKAV